MPATERPEYRPTHWEEVPCPFCGARDAAPYERFGYGLKFTYVRCRSCQLVYQSPRPRYDAEFLEAAYGEYFAFDPAFRLEDTVGGKAYRGWRDELAEIATFDPARSALLDVGSSMGEFLYAARDLYPVRVGVEVSARMADFTRRALGVPILSVPFDRLETDQRFSCIHLSHVIEHVPDPGAWLDRARALLAPGGVIVVNVPHMFSLDRRVKLALKRIGLRRGAWKEPWRTPDHLFEPTIPATLRFVRARGFEVLSYYTYSRRDATARSPWSRIYQRRLHLGSNLRFYLRPA